MFTLFAQAFGIFFVVSLLYVMVAECRACTPNEWQRAVPKRKTSKMVFKRIAASAAFAKHNKH